MARKTVGILTVLLGVVSMATLVSAHHSRAMYDVDKLVSVEGVVTDVQWRNPHMWITLDVPGPNGKTESWGFEGSGAASMVASGISPQILKAGHRVKIIAHPPRDASKHIAEFMGMEVNGKYSPEERAPIFAALGRTSARRGASAQQRARRASDRVA